MELINTRGQVLCDGPHPVGEGFVARDHLDNEHTVVGVCGDLIIVRDWKNRVRHVMPETLWLKWR